MKDYKRLLVEFLSELNSNLEDEDSEVTSFSQVNEDDCFGII